MSWKIRSRAEFTLYAIDESSPRGRETEPALFFFFESIQPAIDRLFLKASMVVDSESKLRRK